MYIVFFNVLASENNNVCQLKSKVTLPSSFPHFLPIPLYISHNTWNHLVHVRTPLLSPLSTVLMFICVTSLVSLALLLINFFVKISSPLLNFIFSFVNTLSYSKDNLVTLRIGEMA